LKKILVFGTGSGAINFIKDCKDASDINVIGFIDSDDKKSDSIFQGKPIYSMDKINMVDYDYIIIASMYTDEINEKLRIVNINNEKILLYGHETDKKKTLKILNRLDYLEQESFKLKNGKCVKSINRYKIDGKVIDDFQYLYNITDQIPLIKRLFKAYKDAKEKKILLDAYIPGENWNNFLLNTRTDFYNIIKSQNIEKIANVLNNFYRNSASTGILGGEEAFNYFKNDDSLIFKEFVQNFRTWNYSVNNGDLKDLVMPNVGNPYGYKINGKIITLNSMLAHYRASYIINLLNDIERPVLAEIGGGYGGLAYFYIKMSQNAVYIDFDLPENLLIESYFLSTCFPNKRIMIYEDGCKLDNNTLQNYDIILMPNFMLPELEAYSIDMFVNTISLGEMEPNIIIEYLNQIARTTKRYFYHENLCMMPHRDWGFPLQLFSVSDNFKELMSGFSRWTFFNLDTTYIVKENLYMRKECNLC
jgi:putative sugar O-methyltransferase